MTKFLNRVSTFTMAMGAVFGSYIPAHAACGPASYYGHNDGFHGRITANGERFNKWGLTAASRSLPMGSRVRVTDQRTGRSVVVRINDRGPYYGNRILDLSYAAFAKIRNPQVGVTKVCYQRIN